MTLNSKLIWVYLISALYIAFNTYLIVNHFMWGALAPLLLIIVLLYFISVDKVIFLIALLTPLAINIRDSEFGIGISLPTEPLMLGVLVFFVIKMLYDGKYDFRILKHPISILIILNLIWLLFTSITSEIPLVSFKFLLARLWFVIPFYFFIILMFKKPGNMKTFIWLYVAGLVVVVFYTLYHHSIRGFDEDSGHWVMTPFYNDHTVYGAALALFIPPLFAFSIMRSYSIGSRIISFSVFLLFVVALVLSYSRAAWLSLALSLVVLVIVLLKIRFQWVLVAAVGLLGLFIVFQQEIFQRLEKNKQDSSANFVEHVQSIANISSDASNLERINRWQSALRMSEERPFWGWGPGTYQFLYAPYQRSKEKTIISTNAGDLGNAHSEYIGPLAESGFLGMISMFLIFSFSVYTGLMVYRKLKNRELKILALSIVIALISYYLHGFLNNFLDSDKASVPIWGFIALLVALDIYHQDSTDDPVSTSTEKVDKENLNS